MKFKALAFFSLLVILPLAANSLPQNRGTTDGFQIVSLYNGTIIQEQASSDFFMPASTAKIITALYALEHLGADYRFPTEIYIQGKIENNILNGDLYIKGYGDPLFLASDAFNLALAIRAKGITKISGNFFYDHSYLPEIFHVTVNGQLETTDNPGICAINLEFNRFKIYLEANDSKNQKQLTAVPTIPHLQANWSETALDVTTPQLRVDGFNEEWIFDKTVTHKYPVHLPVNNVAPYAAQFFTQLSKLAGVELPLPSAKIVPPKAKLLVAHHSIPLIQIVDLNLEYSNNLIAESLLLATAARSKKVESLAQAAEMMKSWLISFTNNEKWKSAKLVSGSGLDDGNQFTPALLTQLLYQVRDLRHHDRFYRSLLSISGIKGWMFKRLDTPPFAHRAWAKTGTLDYSGGLAGYFYGKSGKAYAFSLFSSDQAKRQELKVAKGSKKAELIDRASDCTKSIRERHDRLLQQWIEIL